MRPPIRHVGAYSPVSQSPRKAKTTNSAEITAIPIFLLGYRLTREKHVRLHRGRIANLILNSETLIRYLYLH